MRLTFRTRSALLCAFATMCSSKLLIRSSDSECYYSNPMGYAHTDCQTLVLLHFFACGSLQGGFR